ncbi:very short patch repair endonuclease [Microbacterium sp. NPDC056044]|uniref:very short patch repair endonuclease n=1 Tax=Microbacterium sp. NPDC056044 TaxID=3345690 RepID=UPI0035DB36E9
MYESWASSEAARRTMQGNHSRDTRAELAVRRLVHAAGLRYLVNARPEADLRRTADILFRGSKVAVFIDGCYWHGCPDHFKPPATNVAYWSAKIARNHERDLDTTARLEARGWRVLRIWEHEDPEVAAKQISSAVTQRPA